MGMKQVELPSLLGVHEMTIVNWETGKTKPRGRRLDLVQMFLREKLSAARSTTSQESKAS